MLPELGGNTPSDTACLIWEVLRGTFRSPIGDANPGPLALSPASSQAELVVSLAAPGAIGAMLSQFHVGQDSTGGGRRLASNRFEPVLCFPASPRPRSRASSADLRLGTHGGGGQLEWARSTNGSRAAGEAPPRLTPSGGVSAVEHQELEVRLGRRSSERRRHNPIVLEFRVNNFGTTRSRTVETVTRSANFARWWQ